MTNKEQFINTFGEEAYNTIRNGGTVDILSWFLEDYETKSTIPSISYSGEAIVSKETVVTLPAVAEETKVEEPKKKSRRGGSRLGRGYDLKWYTKAVEDFFLSDNKSIVFKINDDQSSSKKCTTVDGLKSRFISAVEALELSDEILVHKYYKDTCNECVCLEKPAYSGSKASRCGYYDYSKATFIRR